MPPIPSLPAPCPLGVSRKRRSVGTHPIQYHGAPCTVELPGYPPINRFLPAFPGEVDFRPFRISSPLPHLPSFPQMPFWSSPSIVPPLPVQLSSPPSNLA